MADSPGADTGAALGGYNPDAGRPGAPKRIPVPSLLRSLLSDHLDPGYAAAAAERRSGVTRGRAREWAWQGLAGLVVATVFAVATAQAQSVAPAAREAQQVLAGSVRASEAATDQAAGLRASLTAAVDAEQRSRLAGDQQGQQLLGSLDQASFAAAATRVTGPGLSVTITDPGTSKNLSDVSKQRLPGSQQVILDRDLQLVVNSLWVSGAEAISVGGVRITPNVTIRQAGGGILVDNQPISSPYVVEAVGPPHGMQDVFDHSPGLQRLRLLETSYGVGLTVSTADGLDLPAGSARDVNFAKPIGGS